MRINFISPYSFNLHIGDEYNHAIDKYQSDEWICINDQDTLKPPGFAERVHDVVLRHGQPDRLFGAMTNRVGWRNDAVIQSMYHNDSITDHLAMANELWKKNGIAIRPIEIVCGYCMVFQKSLWEKLGGFRSRSVVFDKEISAVADGYLMAGVYIVHLYRWGLPNPEIQTTHLSQIGRLKNPK